MVKAVVRYPRTKKSIEQTMKIVQRELEDGRLKVEVLDLLVNLREKVGDGSKPK